MRGIAKQKVILQAIMNGIRQGTLEPGDRLEGVKALCTRYGTGQPTVEAAIRDLRNRELVEVRRRSGCYIAPGARTRLDELDRMEASASVPRNVLPFLAPAAEAHSKERTVTLYLSETAEGEIKFWRDYLEKRIDAEIRILGPRDGRLEKMHQEHPLDVIQTTPLLLNTIGLNHFLPLKDLKLEDLRIAKDFLPAIRGRFADPVFQIALPMVLVAQYLFVNTDLAQALGAPQSFGAGWDDFFETCLTLQKKHRKAPFRILNYSTFFDLLHNSGAVAWNGRSGAVLNLKRAQQLFRQLQGSELPPFPHEELFSHFCSGKTLYLLHCTFTARHLLTTCQTPWLALPTPLETGVPGPSWLIALAVLRKTRNARLAAEVVRCLAGPETQELLAGRHGNLPVKSRPIADRTPIPQVPVETVNATVKQLSARMSEVERHQLESRIRLHGVFHRLLAGKGEPEEATTALQQGLGISGP